MVLTKTSSEDVRLWRTYSSWSIRLEDVFKTSSEDEDERHLQDVFKKSSSRRMFAGLFLSRVGVQYPAPGFRSTRFKLPLQNVSVCIYIIFVFWNEIESLSIAQHSCRKPKVNLMIISLHLRNNLSGTSVFELLWWRGCLFCNFCQNLWKISVNLRGSLASVLLKMNFFKDISQRFWEQVHNNYFIKPFSKDASEWRSNEAD